MTKDNLEIRVHNLENTVGGLSGLPQQFASLASQFVQLRQDVRSDISAIRGGVEELRVEMSTLTGGLRGEMSTLASELRGEMRTLGSELRGEMTSMHHDLARAILANGIEMRVLHEVVMARLAVIGEARSPHETPRRAPEP